MWPDFLALKAKNSSELEYRDDPEGLLGPPSTYFRDRAEACKRALQIWKSCTDNMSPEVGLIESLCAMMMNYIKTREETVRITTASLLRQETKTEAGLEIADLIEAGEMEGWNEIRV
jgi:hypothetical protein